MIPPSRQWAIQIDVTNSCWASCSNCTRLLDHARQRFFMSPECYRTALRAVKSFLTDAEPCVGKHTGRRRIIGMIGGEPLMHPKFPELVDIAIEEIPDVRHRGLWTSLDWLTGVSPKWGAYRPQVERLIGANPTHDASGPMSKHSAGYVNWNMHLPQQRIEHTPLLVAAQDVIPDEKLRMETIEQCWLQQEWSSTATPKGYFFCEVAGHFDMIFDGPGGLPLEPDVWKGDLRFERDAAGVPRPVGKFAEQIERWCNRCGASVPMKGRSDGVQGQKGNRRTLVGQDDISPSNLIPLQSLKSPRVKKGANQPGGYVPTQDGHELLLRDVDRAKWHPERYVKGERIANQAAVAKGLEDDPAISARRRD